MVVILADKLHYVLDAPERCKGAVAYALQECFGKDFMQRNLLSNGCIALQAVLMQKPISRDATPNDGRSRVRADIKIAAIISAP